MNDQGGMIRASANLMQRSSHTDRCAVVLLDKHHFAYGWGMAAPKGLI
jgi:hypothetical protein